MSDPVVTVMRVPAMIAIEVVPHVDQLLGDNDLLRTRLLQVNAFQVDQQGVFPRAAHEAVGAAIRGWNEPANPLAIRGATGADHEAIRGQGEQLRIPMDEVCKAGIAFVEDQDFGVSRSTARISLLLDRPCILQWANGSPTQATERSARH